MLSADVEFCCPSAWSLLSAYMEYELSVVSPHGLGQMLARVDVLQRLTARG